MTCRAWRVAPVPLGHSRLLVEGPRVYLGTRCWVR